MKTAPLHLELIAEGFDVLGHAAVLEVDIKPFGLDFGKPYPHGKDGRPDPLMVSRIPASISAASSELA
jgi:hypothetical protein